MRVLRIFIKWLPTVKSGSLSAYGVAFAAVVLGTLVRFGVGALFGQSAVPYATYYPAVLIAAIIGGGRSGILTMLLGALSGYFLFSPGVPVPAANLPPVPIVSSLLYFFNCGLIIAFATVYRMSVADLVHEHDRVIMLSGELQHRIKNMGAVVQAIVSRTLGPQHPATETLKRRIAVLISNHVQLDGKSHSGRVREVVEVEIGPYRNARVHLVGDDAPLGSHAALCLTLALHELVTNALKYGALSTPYGRINLTWLKEAEGLSFAWIETDGPLVGTPAKSGFGTALLKNVIEECGGRIELDFKPQGLSAHFILPDFDTPKFRN